jgi:phospholipid/cholesterol/gamma-HCH transport system permease protein
MFIRQKLINAGVRFQTFAVYLGGVVALTLKTVYAIFRRRIDFDSVVVQLWHIGNKSLSIVSLIAVFTGMVFALQFSVGLSRFGLQMYVGQVIGIAIMRELGPVLTSLMVAARVGSGIAAEIGSMVVTEQVVAIEAMGANPVAKLVVPRVLACMFATPILAVISCALGVLGGMVITMMEAGVSMRFYMDQIWRSVLMSDLASGIGKTFFFGFFVAVIACFQGLQTEGGTEGVGVSTTKAVVYSSIFIFITDFFLTKLFLLVF